MWMYIFLVMTYKSECKPFEHNADCFTSPPGHGHFDNIL